MPLRTKGNKSIIHRPGLEKCSCAKPCHEKEKPEFIQERNQAKKTTVIPVQEATNRPVLTERLPNFPKKLFAFILPDYTFFVCN